MTTPTDVSRQHLAAIRERLADALSTEDYPIYQGEVTTPEDQITYPYLVIWPTPPGRPTVTMTGSSTGIARTVHQITAAGTSVDEVIAALDRVSLALAGWQPSIPGRLCTPVKQDPDQAPPPRRDDRVKSPAGRPVYMSFLIFTLSSSERSTPS